MKKKMSLVLLAVFMSILFCGTAFAASDKGTAQPTGPDEGYPSYEDGWIPPETSVTSPDSTVTLEIIDNPDETGIYWLVTETDGETPVAGARVDILTAQSGVLAAAVTDADGAAFIPLPYPDVAYGTYGFSVSKDGYITQEVTVDFNGDAVQKHVLLERNPSLREFVLTVVDPDGSAVEGASISLAEATSGAPTASGKTDGNGVLRVQIPRGYHSFNVVHPHFKAKSGTIECREEGGARTIVLEHRTYPVKVRVLDAGTAQGLAGALVTVDGSLMFTTPDGGEQPVPEGLAAGTHTFRVECGGYAQTEVQFTVTRQEGVQVVTVALVKIPQNISPGLVDDLANGNGGSGGNDGGGQSANNGNGANQPGAVPAPQAASLTQTVKRSIDVEACIVDADGNYIEGAALTFLPENLKLASDADGRAVFHGAALGGHTIEAEKSGSRGSVDFEIIAGNEKDIVGSKSGARVFVTDDMEIVTLYLELDKNVLRFVGMTEEAKQTEELASEDEAQPYVQEAQIEPQTEAGTPAGKIDENSLLWLVIALSGTAAGCGGAVYYQKKKDEEELNSEEI